MNELSEPPLNEKDTLSTWGREICFLIAKGRNTSTVLIYLPREQSMSILLKILTNTQATELAQDVKE